MSLLKSLVKNLRQQAAGQRTWTPHEVRELIQRAALADAKQALEHLNAAVPQRDAVRACLLGEVCFQEGSDESALHAFKEALRLAPGMPSAHYGMSLLMAESDSVQDALRHAFFADSVEPNDPRFLAQVGYCQLKLGNAALAENPLRRAVARAPLDAHAWNNLGLVLLAKGEPIEARDCLQLAVRLHPTFAAARENLAHLESAFQEVAPSDGVGFVVKPVLSEDDPSRLLLDVHKLEVDGLLQAAIDACEYLSLQHSSNALIAIEAHRLYVRAGDTGSGIDVLQSFHARHPENDDVTAALGSAMLSTREFRSAEELLHMAVKAKPQEIDRLLDLAQALTGQERFAEAGLHIATAMALAPDVLKVRAAYASNLLSQCRYEEVLAVCSDMQSKGLRLSSLGIVLGFLGRVDEACDELTKELCQRPNDPQVRFHLANFRLLQLDFERGWDDYRYRLFSDASNFRVAPFPLWKGESMEGKTVLVLAEQGIGDQVMFASCLPDLLRLKPRKVILEVVERIAPTIARSFPEVEVVPTNQGRRFNWLQDHPDIELYVPLGDLPSHFRRTQASFPSHRGYLVPDESRVQYWRKQLANAGAGPYIGFSWKGGTESTRMPLRTTSINAFSSLAAARKATWVCLQYGAVEDQVNAAEREGFKMSYWPAAISNLDEFAALVSAMDLVVTVCNTTVHYAGATGRPVWVLAPKVPEWRYGLNNPTMPWYPSSRLFRQSVAGNWEGVFDEVRQELSIWHPT